MAIDDDTVLTYRALRDLNLLYDAYRAAARAHAVVLRQMGRALALQIRPAEETLELQQRLSQRFALARETDLVFHIRSEQVKRRMSGLREGDTV